RSSARTKTTLGRSAAERGAGATIEATIAKANEAIRKAGVLMAPLKAEKTPLVKSPDSVPTKMKKAGRFARPPPMDWVDCGESLRLVRGELGRRRLRDDIVGDVAGTGGVVRELHGELPAAGGHGAKVADVAEHFAE